MKTRPRVPIGIPVAAVILLVLGLIARSVVPSTFSEEQLASNVLLGAIPFILIFVAIILVFISLIWLLGSVLNNNVSQRIYRPIEAMTIGGIAVGILAMMQPWSFAAFRIGFHVLLLSTIGFIVWSHIIPRGAQRHDDAGSVSVGDVVSD